MNLSKWSTEQAKMAKERMRELGVKFLPSQAIARIVSPSASQKVLGSGRRRKAAKQASQAAKSQGAGKK